MSTKEVPRCGNTGACATDNREATQEPSTLHIEYQNGPSVNIRRRPCIVPALLLGFVAFSICFLAGHVTAAIFGWHALVYIGIGFGFGCWFFASCIVAFAVSGVMHRD